MKPDSLPAPIQSSADLEAALEQGPVLIFKHSPICPTSLQAFGEYRRFREQHPAVPSVWIDVIGGRPYSLELADCVGIKHESPQALWIVDGQAQWNASHGAITQESLAAACAP